MQRPIELGRAENSRLIYREPFVPSPGTTYKGFLATSRNMLTSVDCCILHIAYGMFPVFPKVSQLHLSANRRCSCSPVWAAPLLSEATISVSRHWVFPSHLPFSYPCAIAQDPACLIWFRQTTGEMASIDLQ
ncbi:hypothetical protein HZ326_11206 [Fusarium oxysporum f. sp. albedinis]|nr:hypothetical protein HZ326_11206 [Fusarium oxysporum f. sp. albedinis]